MRMSDMVTMYMSGLFFVLNARMVSMVVIPMCELGNAAVGFSPV